MKTPEVLVCATVVTEPLLNEMKKPGRAVIELVNALQNLSDIQ